MLTVQASWTWMMWANFFPSGSGQISEVPDPRNATICYPKAFPDPQPNSCILGAGTHLQTSLVLMMDVINAKGLCHGDAKMLVSQPLFTPKQVLDDSPARL